MHIKRVQMWWDSFNLLKESSHKFLRILCWQSFGIHTSMSIWEWGQRTQDSGIFKLFYWIGRKIPFKSLRFSDFYLTAIENSTFGSSLFLRRYTAFINNYKAFFKMNSCFVNWSLRTVAAETSAVTLNLLSSTLTGMVTLIYFYRK